jgi:hypothetical protein
VEDIMTSTTSDPAAAQPGRPPVVDLATWQAARDELLVREKAHTREGDAIAAARRRLPMVEFDPTVEVTGPDGPVPFLDVFQGRDELLVYKHMWWDGAPHQGQCEGCTIWAWQDNPEGWPAGNGPCWYWRTDADGNATWGGTGRPVPQWTRPGATPEETLGRQGDYH